MTDSVEPTMEGEDTQEPLGEEDAKKAWPAVEAAQAFVIPSYQWMIARVEAADSRIQTLAAFIATVSMAIPTLSRALDPSIPFDSWWFISAMVAAAAAIIIAVIARARGALDLPSPQVLWQESMQLTPWEFQRDALYWAGIAFENNRQLVNNKAEAVAWMSGCFGLELLLFLGWTVWG
jgi:hypothetical protein